MVMCESVRASYNQRSSLMFLLFEGILTLGWIGWLAISLFFIALTVSVTYDRRGNEDPKWWVFGLGLVAVFAYGWHYKDWTFSNAWDVVRSWDFWVPMGVYLLIGVAYSVVEFIVDVRRSARFYAAEFKTFLETATTFPVLNADGTPKTKDKLDRSGRPIIVQKPNPNRGPDEPATITGNEQEAVTREGTIAENYAAVKAKGAEAAEFNGVLANSQQFIQRYSYKNRIIELSLNKTTKVDIEPKINKLQMTEHVTAWTFLWPVYAVSLILGDLLTEIFRVIVDVMVNLSGRFVKLSFADVFKF